MKETNTIFINGPIGHDFISSCILSTQSQKYPGAHSIFLGQVRPDTSSDIGVVKRIEYSAYIKMAENRAFELRNFVKQKYDLITVIFYHSLGIVHSGEICLFVYVTSKHRKAAIQGCELLVELIKKDLPVWGREIYEDNSFSWKVNVQRNENFR
jgi:molybdopterin synthase catalytic subunit